LKRNLTIEQKIVLVAILITGFLMVLGFFSPDEKTRTGVMSNAFILFAFMLILPFIFLKYQRERRIKEMEEKMPTFLRDIVESLSSGAPFHQAIVLCSKVDYGELSREVKKMANQISWGMPVNKVFDQFIERVKSSKKLYMSLKILRESYFTGGNVISTLNSLADNLTQLNELEKERSSILNQYVILLYAIVFIFVAILVAINRLMIPIFKASEIPGEVAVFKSPCSDISSPICEIFAIPPKYIFGLEPTSIASYYISIFFYMSTIIAATCGVVVGEIKEKSIVSGLKHSIILTMAVWGTLLFLKVMNFLGV
jgi:flagellar protein FlaJ